MAINPNTDFTAGQVLTADQQNRFGRGVVAYTESITGSGAIGAEAVQVTSTSFTAVANRYYKVTYFEPKLSASLNGNQCTQRIRLTSIGGTVLQSSYMQPNTANFVMNICEVVLTFSAGTTTLVGTLQMGGTNVFAGRSATEKAFIVVEDIGPA
jgi:hypothetical protein